MPFNPLTVLAFALFALVSLILLQIGIFTLAFDKLGLSADSAMLLLFASLLGSTINLPLFRIKASAADGVTLTPRILRLLKVPLPPFEGYTTIALNVGGGLIPVIFSLYLLRHTEINGSDALLATALVASVSYFFSRPVAGIGVAMPLLIAPLAAAIIALIIDTEHSAPLAYIAGTLGVLIGADLLRLRDIKKMGTPIAAIGGAGTFDGIFITGIVAALLA